MLLKLLELTLQLIELVLSTEPFSLHKSLWILWWLLGTTTKWRDMKNNLCTITLNGGKGPEVGGGRKPGWILEDSGGGGGGDGCQSKNWWIRLTSNQGFKWWKWMSDSDSGSWRWRWWCLRTFGTCNRSSRWKEVADCLASSG